MTVLWIGSGIVLVMEVTMRSLMLALVVVGLASAAPNDAESDKQKKVKEEIGKLEGTWQAGSLIDDGEQKSDEVLKYMRWTFKGNKLFSTKAFTITENDKTRVEGQGGTVETDYQIDPTMKLKVLTGETVRPFEGRKTTAIYSLEGDTLKVCGYPDKNALPGEFSAGKGTGRILITLKRKKETKEGD
jgi:uncharacterized protein (TIGR03067 family)